MALNKIERAHQLYRDGRHEEALGFYTEALSMAKSKPQKIALHSNRAACFLKLHNFKKAAEECTSVLELDQNHTGALMLRAQTLVTLKEYHSALFDVNRLMELNPSSEVYRNLEARLKTQLVPDERSKMACNKGNLQVVTFSSSHVRKSLAPIPECEAEQEEEEEEVVKTEVVERNYEEKNVVDPVVQKEQKAESTGNFEVIASQKQIVNNGLSEENSRGWQAIAKPKGHSRLDYSRWDSVDDDSSEDEDDEDDESQLQYRFRVRNVGVKPVK
ncbi:hypothetical protein RJ641_034937 [Dillenia turbinata]|uniref:Uncharacterized protein n=1 Tax=Dillenia turbinata TaxID=194707 RepID=A0AAN8VWF9_9MAGN